MPPPAERTVQSGTLGFQCPLARLFRGHGTERRQAAARRSPQVALAAMVRSRSRDPRGAQADLPVNGPR